MRSNQDRRSPEAEGYRRLYKTARWQRTRTAQLETEPLCRRCKAQGRLTPATTVHHSIPHKGDETLFWSGPFESLCSPCHDGPTQQAEHRGFSTEVGDDGWPLDPAHPVNRPA